MKRAIEITAVVARVILGTGAIVALVALVALVTTAGAAGLSLAPQWRVGQDYPHHLVLTQISVTRMIGHEPVRQEVGLAQEFNVRGLATNRLGGVDLELHWRDARARVNMLGAGEHVLPTARLRCALDPGNRVARVEGLAQWHALAFGAEPPAVRAALQGLFSERFVRDWVELGCDLPGTPVAPGARWNSRVALPLDALGEATLERAFTLEKLETNAAVVVFRGRILPPAQGGAATLGGLVKVEGGVVSGRLELDPARSVITAATLERELTLVTTLPTRSSAAPDAPWQDQMITNVLNQSASWRRTAAP